MWTEITRTKYERKGLGYSSDLSDAEWAMIEPRSPRRNRLGRPPKTEVRSVVNALLYMVRPLGRRTHAGLAQSQPSPRQRLRGDNRQRQSLALSCFGPASL